MRANSLLRLIAAAGLAVGGFSLGTAAPPAATRDTRPDTWVATDGLGRSLPDARECPAPRPNRVVGIFYFLWVEGNANSGLYDLSKLLAANPTNPAYGPLHAFHHWGEPRLGYYVMTDEFVIRKHAQMLTDAGVDVIIFDVTNGPIYEDVLLAICRVYEKIRLEGGRTPRISFIAHSHADKVITTLYERFYAKNLHPDLWFRWLGKPLFLGPDDNLAPAVRDFFTLRDSWAWTKGHQWFGDGRDKWPWLDNHPQTPGWHTRPEEPEEITVCVAQHPTSNIGRSFHNGRQPPPGQTQTEQGLCFAEQWKRALEVDPQFVFVTGWNEWVAQRFTNTGGISLLGKPLKKGETFFVDQYNQEFSRDIEPMRGGHGDNYYYQLAANVRRFKGVRPSPKAGAPLTVAITQDFRPWARVAPEYLDDLFDTTHRHHPGWGPLSKRPFQNTSGRNDFDTLKVARDATHLYLYARTRQPLTPPTGSNWMRLWLDTDCNHATGWEGYDYQIACQAGDPTRVVVFRHTGGSTWQAAGEGQCAWAGNELHLAVPRALLGLPPEKGPLRFDFKWTDNVPDTGDILDFIDQGDTAPNSRFNYRFQE